MRKRSLAVRLMPEVSRLKPLGAPTSSPPIADGVRIGHVHLKVADLDRAISFYSGVLGCSVKHRMPQYGMLELSAGVTLVDTGDPNGAWALEGTSPGRNLDHFAIADIRW